VSSVEPVRWADHRPMLVAGIRRTHTFAEAKDGIRAQWAELGARGRVPGQVPGAAYGVICGGDAEAGTVDYLCGVEVSSFDGVGPEAGRVRVPAAHYAVFSHRGGIDTLGAAWDAIFGTWLPRSGRRSAQSPDFERYDERYDPAAGTGEIELWVPVEPEGTS
jgi:AraC family transcriptional regulator